MCVCGGGFDQRRKWSGGRESGEKSAGSLFDLMDLSLIQQDALDDTSETNSRFRSFVNGRAAVVAPAAVTHTDL